MLKRPPPWLLTRPDCATADGDVGSGGAGGPLPRGGAARTPGATSTTRRTLLELMAKMHFAEHTLFTLFGFGNRWGVGIIRDVEARQVSQFVWGRYSCESYTNIS